MNWLKDSYGVKNLSEVSASATINAGSLSLDLSTAGVYYVSLNASVTSISFTNVQTPGSAACTLILTADGTPRTIVWGSSILWPAGTAPTLTSTNGKRDVFSFVTLNGGTNWYGFVGGQNF